MSHVYSPFDPPTKLKKNNGENVSQYKYSYNIGSLLYLGKYTRPDVVYAISRLDRYTHNLNALHWSALKRFFKLIMHFIIIVFLLL
jgi:hypothetical protein